MQKLSAFPNPMISRLINQHMEDASGETRAFLYEASLHEVDGVKTIFSVKVVPETSMASATDRDTKEFKINYHQAKRFTNLYILPLVVKSEMCDTILSPSETQVSPPI